jgi:hypothetical protein
MRPNDNSGIEGIRVRILQHARPCYAGLNDHDLREKLGEVADSRRSSFRRVDCSNPEHALTHFPGQHRWSSCLDTRRLSLSLSISPAGWLDRPRPIPLQFVLSSD